MRGSGRKIPSPDALFTGTFPELRSSGSKGEGPMQVRTAVIAWAILLGCGGASSSGGGVAATSSQASTASPATPASPSDTPQPTPAAPPDATPAPPPSPPAPPSPAWAGTQTLAAPWTELDGVATIPGGGLVLFGSQFLVK